MYSIYLNLMEYLLEQEPKFKEEIEKKEFSETQKKILKYTCLTLSVAFALYLWYLFGSKGPGGNSGTGNTGVESTGAGVESPIEIVTTTSVILATGVGLGEKMVEIIVENSKVENVSSISSIEPISQIAIEPILEVEEELPALIEVEEAPIIALIEEHVHVIKEHVHVIEEHYSEEVTKLTENEIFQEQVIKNIKMLQPIDWNEYVTLKDDEIEDEIQKVLYEQQKVAFWEKVDRMAINVSMEHMNKQAHYIYITKEDITSIQNDIFIKYRVDNQGNIYNIQNVDINQGFQVGYKPEIAGEAGVLVSLEPKKERPQLFFISNNTIDCTISTFLKRYNIQENHFYSLTTKEQINFFLNLRRSDVEFWFNTPEVIMQSSYRIHIKIVIWYFIGRGNKYNLSNED